MKIDELLQEIELERENVTQVLSEMALVFHENASVQTRKTAAAAYIAQCYTGIENVMKRIARYHGAAVFSGNDWHIELLKMFRSGNSTLPALLDDSLFNELSLMRKFRHVVMHNYGFTLDWDMVKSASESTPSVVERFFSVVSAFLESLAGDRFRRGGPALF